MKVGSIVECINTSGIRFAVVPKLNTPYTVREIIDIGHKIPNGYGGGLISDHVCILLEEIVNHKFVENFVAYEPGYKIERFRELLPPDALQDEITELLTEPVTV